MDTPATLRKRPASVPLNAEARQPTASIGNISPPHARSPPTVRPWIMWHRKGGRKSWEKVSHPVYKSPPPPAFVLRLWLQKGGVFARYYGIIVTRFLIISGCFACNLITGNQHWRLIYTRLCEVFNTTWHTAHMLKTWGACASVPCIFLLVDWVFSVTTAVALVWLATALCDLARYCELWLPFFRRLLWRLDFRQINLKMVQISLASFLLRRTRKSSELSHRSFPIPSESSFSLRVDSASTCWHSRDSRNSPLAAVRGIPSLASSFMKVMVVVVRPRWCRQKQTTNRSDEQEKYL